MLNHIPENIRRDLLHVCQRMYARGLVAGTDGNVSVRLSEDRVVATPTGMSKGFLQEDDLVVCDLHGTKISGSKELTTEIKIHLAAYEERPDVCAIVHAHPPFATAFAVAGRAPSEKLMPEAYIAVGKVALTPYGTPSTDELADRIRPFLRDHEAVLLANHGAMTLGRDLLAAYHRMEALEQLAKISSITHELGGARSLSTQELAELDSIRGVYGETKANLPCYRCGWTPEPKRAAPRRPHEYVAPEVHWPGNAPVWERPNRTTTADEEQVRALAKRALREQREK